MSIIISQQGRNAVKLDSSNFKDEDYLQNYIHNNPESIPVYELHEDKKLFVAAREFPTNSGPIDALAIDKDGDVYIVETKLYKNPDKRTVLAQALDYGSALWKHLNDFDVFIKMLDERVKANFNLTFKDKASEFFNLNSQELNFMLEAMKKNLNEGSLKFVILMDALEERLKDLILYVNQNSQFDIYAVQLEYYKYEQFEIMIPKLFGVEVKKNIKTASNLRRIWNEIDFINQAKELLGENSNKVIELYNFFKQKADKIKWGTGKVNGSYAPCFNNLSRTSSFFSLYSNGEIYVKFNWMYKNENKRKLVKRIAQIFIEECRQNTKLNLPDNYLNEDFSIESEKFLRESEGVNKAVKKMLEEL